MMAEDGSRTFQARRALLAQLAPRYQQASLAQKTLLLDAFVAWTGYTRKKEILALLQAHPAWVMGHLAPERAVSPPTRISAHGLNTICSPLQTRWEEPWSPEHTQREPPISHPAESHCYEEAISEASQSSTQAQSLRVVFPDTSSSTTREDEARPRALTTLEQAIATYLQEMHIRGRAPKTIEWHQTSLFALQQYLWRQFHLTDVGQFSRCSLQSWVTDLSNEPVTRTGARRTVSTVAAYARSARAFCNWLVRQGYVSELLFPKDAIPQIQPGLPQPVEPEAFVRLLRACQLAGSPAGLNAGLEARNRAILWLLWDTGLQVAEVCRLRLADVDCVQGTVILRGKGGDLRTLPLSADGQRAMCTYLEQARLTSPWEPVVPEARDQLLLTERRHPLTKNSLTMLFKRLSQRAGFSWSRKSDGYAVADGRRSPSRADQRSVSHIESECGMNAGDKLSCRMVYFVSFKWENICSSSTLRKIPDGLQITAVRMADAPLTEAQSA
jgi:site-specific recombinase XerD